MNRGPDQDKLFIYVQINQLPYTYLVWSFLFSLFFLPPSFSSPPYSSLSSFSSFSISNLTIKLSLDQWLINLTEQRAVDYASWATNKKVMHRIITITFRIVLKQYVLLGLMNTWWSTYSLCRRVISHGFYAVCVICCKYFIYIMKNLTYGWHSTCEWNKQDFLCLLWRVQIYLY